MDIKLFGNDEKGGTTVIEGRGKEGNQTHDNE